MSDIKFMSGQVVPLEMHRARIVQQIELKDIETRIAAITEAGNNTFLLRNRDVFLDMLTDSGVNAMSDAQQAAMLCADDSYAGSETFYRLEEVLRDVFQKEYFLPAHQGRACEHLISKIFVKPGSVVPMNYHFTTAKAHITTCGGEVEEIPVDDALQVSSVCKFKGNLDIDKLKKLFAQGLDIPFVRLEAGTNLIGGQPLSLENIRQTSEVCRAQGVPLVLDASLLMDNLYFIKVREEAARDMSILEITREIAKCSDMIYFSGRKLGSARGGGICTSDTDIYLKIRGLIPLFEGFLTYGGMSVREMEAMAVGIRETMNINVISQGPQFISFMTDELIKNGVPVVTPSGGLGCHVDAMRFLPHLKQSEYPAGALASAIYIISGARGMERGTLSEQRDKNGVEPAAHMELVRLALPRRVFSMSHVLYMVDRITWLYNNRDIVGGLSWTEEPEILRFFYGKLAPTSDWQQRLLAKFKEDFGESL